ncbi:ATP-binding protein [Alloalcanivorax mobilis]|uniref:ATP-binding protein n=1 Tax=Alloalcanivorax mobilis TaxID=2019569 RepID=UPI000B5B16FD|nr:ATP-binding protein [Alloalcanivorax mobilis]ASK34678.1 two-component sensor histidine kinase [Alcanivorax sp. N3-2A]
MNSIFIRIYGGILVALLVIGALTYAGVELVNDYRSQLYRERMARGTFYLLAEGYQDRASAADRDAWTRLLSRMMGAAVELLDKDALKLSYREKLHLDEGRVVMRPANDSGATQVLYAVQGQPLYLSTRVTRLSEQQARATGALVLEYLSRRPAAQQERALERLKQEFGFPLDLVGAGQLMLDLDQRQRLERQEMVFTLTDSTRRDASVLLYVPMGDSGRVLVMGPLHLFDQFPWQLLAIAGVAALVLVALATYMQVRPLQRRLRRLDHAVNRLGSGDLSAHADIPGSDPIGQVGAAFNGMTAHIRRLIEAQREMTRAVSHELRTPVARLRFGLEMLADCESADERRGKLNDLDRDIEQLDHLIDEILTYARLEEGTPNIDFQDVYLYEVCEQLIGELETIRGDIVIDARGDRGATLEGDPRYLHRVLQNLVTNALRYAKGRVRMTISEDQGRLVLDVDDDGPGIAEHHRERVFKPFARLDKSRHRASGGYGLGLSIVKRIVDWHGGEIRVEQSDWGGARFRVILPREQRQSHVLGRERKYKVDS